MFHALNSSSESSSDTDPSGDSSDSESEENPTSEIKEDTIHEKYRKALQFYSVSNFIEAKKLFEQLINEKVFVDISKTKSSSKLELKQLYFAAMKNLAAIFAEENNSNLSVDYYLKAIDICQSDVVVYYRLGAEACKSEQFSLARSAFEEGLRLSPDHWLCLDKLIAVLYVVGDYANCLIEIKKALDKNNNYIRGLILKDEIYYRNPYLASISKEFFDGMTLGTYGEKEKTALLNRLNGLADKMMENSRPKPPLIIKPPCPLASLSWLSLAESLYRNYDEFEKTNISLSNFVDLSDWINNTKQQEIVPFPVPAVDNLPSSDVVNSSLDISMDIQGEGSGPADSISVVRDSTMDSVVSESDNDTKSVTAASTTSGADVGFDEAQGVVNSDQETAFVLSRQPTKVTSRGRKRKTQQHASLISEAKRRSSRLIPGFFMEDPEAFGPLTTKPISLKDQLFSYLPEKFMNTSPDDDQMVNCCTSAANEYTISDEFLNCDLLDELGADDVLDLLKTSHECCFIELLWNFVKMFRNSWRKKWSNQFCLAYLNCCKRWTRHVQFVTPDSMSESTEWLREVAEVRILAAELELKFSPVDVQYESTFLTEYLSQMSVFRSTYGPEWTTFACRVSFYRAKRAEFCKNYDVARSFLEQCSFWLNMLTNDVYENVAILLPNVEEKLCKSLIDQKLNELEKRCVLNSVEKYFQLGEYQSVVDVLSTRNDVCPEGVGGVGGVGAIKEKFERSKLLAKCYLVLNDYNSLANSVVDVLKLCMDVYRRLNFVDKYDWWKNFDEILSWANICLRQNDRIFADCKLAALKTFAETLIELIVCFLDYAGGNQSQKDGVPFSCWIDPWILLYKICKQIEIENLNDDKYVKSWYATADSHNVVLATKSLMILHRGHEELGKKGLCMLKDGQLLSTLAEELMKSLRHPKVAQYLTSSINDDTLNCAEQCFYCLYNYPRKRSRCLVEHYAKNITLTWDRAQLVFDFVRPEHSPEFDDQPHNCISAETVHLLHRIEALIPDDLKPNQFHVQLEDYIDGRRTNMPPNERFNDAPIVRDLYHLLADSYGKAKDKDLKKVCLYYELDLCVSNDRVDSWAGLALHKGTIVDQVLNSLDLKHDDDGLSYVNNLAQPALFCYRRATSMIPDHVVLMVEHGSLAYAMYSFVRRIYKRRFAGKSDSEKAVKLKKIMVDYLTESRTAFESANRVPRTLGLEHKEEWVRYYMLGKIAEKFCEKPSTVLPLYNRAAYFLHLDGAKYPTRVQYNSSNYAFEALEIFYRVHASALKWLLNKNNLDENELTTIWKFLRMFCYHPFKANVQQGHHHGRPSMVEKKLQNHGRLFVDPDVVELVDSLMHDVELSESKSATSETSANFPLDAGVAQAMDHILTESEAEFRRKTRREIIKWSMDAMYICIKRCFHCPHYKSYYWLAKYYLFSDEVKDVEKSRRILIGQVDPHVSPFFQNLKGANLFEGIWVIPTDDVSRAGSLAAHLHKMVALLQKILIKLNDYERLCDLSLLLMKKPGTAKSKYLKEYDREFLANAVLNSVEFVLKKEFEKSRQSPKTLENICLTAYNCFEQWTHLHDNVVGRRNKWSDLIKWLYKNISGNDSPDVSIALNYLRSLSTRRREEQRSSQMAANRPNIRDYSASPNMRKAETFGNVQTKTYSKSSLLMHKPVEKRDLVFSDCDVVILSPDPKSSTSSNEITIIKEVGVTNVHRHQTSSGGGRINRPSTSTNSTNSARKIVSHNVRSASTDEDSKTASAKQTYLDGSQFQPYVSPSFRPRTGSSNFRQRSPIFTQMTPAVRQTASVPHLPKGATVRQMLDSKATKEFSSKTNLMNKFLSNMAHASSLMPASYQRPIGSPRMTMPFVDPMQFLLQQNILVNPDQPADMASIKRTTEALKHIITQEALGHTSYSPDLWKQLLTATTHQHKQMATTSHQQKQTAEKTPASDQSSAKRHQVAKKSIHNS